jgi:hypothetical protein
LADILIEFICSTYVHVQPKRHTKSTQLPPVAMAQRIFHQWGTQATTHAVICLQMNFFIAPTMFIRIGSQILPLWGTWSELKLFASTVLVWRGMTKRRMAK